MNFMPKKVTKKTKVGGEGKLYQVSLSVNNKVFKAEADVLLEALGLLENPVSFVSMGTITVIKNGKKAEILLSIPRLRNLFADKTFRRIMNDNLEIMLK